MLSLSRLAPTTETITRAPSFELVLSEAISPMNSVTNMQLTRTCTPIEDCESSCFQHPHPYPNPQQGSKTVVVLVGLPASGKSSVTRVLLEYFGRTQVRAQKFNVGERRREDLDASDHTLFDPKNDAGTRARQGWAQETLGELLQALYVEDTIDVGVFDATNTTRERREWLVKACVEAADAASATNRSATSTPLVTDIIFLTVSVTSPPLLHYNISRKLHNADYHAVPSRASALRDFILRYKNYQSVYEPFGVEEQMALMRMVPHGRLEWVEIVDLKGGLRASPTSLSSPGLTDALGIAEAMSGYIAERESSEFLTLAKGHWHLHADPHASYFEKVRQFYQTEAYRLIEALMAEPEPLHGTPSRSGHAPVPALGPANIRVSFDL